MAKKNLTDVTKSVLPCQDKVRLPLSTLSLTVNNKMGTTVRALRFTNTFAFGNHKGSNCGVMQGKKMRWEKDLPHPHK